MIRDTADALWENSILFCDATHVWPETFPEIWNQDRNALFCAKDAMDVQTRESVRHSGTDLIQIPYRHNNKYKRFDVGCRVQNASSITA